MNIIESLERHANEMRDGECWTTTYKTTDANPYPRCHGRKIHRIAWEAHHAEPIPEGMDVLHRCNNPQCFNPEHLYLGTDVENTRDRMEAGTYVPPVPKPRVYDYEEFLTLHDDELFSCYEISKLTGADPTTVRQAIERATG